MRYIANSLKEGRLIIILLGTEGSSSNFADEIPRAFIGIETAVANIICRIMSAKEEFARIVSQSDALSGDLEVNYCSDRQRLLIKQHCDGLFDSLRSRQ